MAKLERKKRERQKRNIYYVGIYIYKYIDIKTHVFTGE